MISSKPTINTKFNRVALRSNHYSLKFDKNLQIARYAISIQGESNGGSNDLVANQIQKIKSQLDATFSSSHFISGKILYKWSNQSSAAASDEELLTLRNGDTAIDFKKVAGLLKLSELEREDIANKSELLQAANIWLAAMMSTLQLKELGGSSGQYFNLDNIEGEV